MNIFSKKLFHLTNKQKSKMSQLKIFDIEEEQAFEEKLMLPILNSLDEISQINYLGSLFLCGVNTMIASNSGSFLLKIAINITSPLTSILVNSTYCHSNPALIGWKNEFLFVIGGKNQEECEYYSIRQPNWHKLPSLPEERYKCNLLSDEPNNLIYLFGGFCTIGNKNVKTILKLNILQGLQWEMIIISENEGLLGRNSSICLQYNSNSSIFILGGKDDEGKSTDYIVEYDPQNKTVSTIKQTLIKPSFFDEQNGIDLNKTQFNFIDSEGFVFKICKSDFRIFMFNFEILLKKGNNNKT